VASIVEMEDRQVLDVFFAWISVALIFLIFILLSLSLFYSFFLFVFLVIHEKQSCI
jgi:hypothetical protein